MAKRINEDVRFFLPSDPYYHEVDNLPLEDLAENDKRLQNQIDELAGNLDIPRSGFAELRPSLDAANPGRIFVNAGNFIGRAQRSTRTAGSQASPGETSRSSEGLIEQNNNPAELYETSKYNVTNPPAGGKEAWGATVGRTSLFLFGGGSIAVDSFNPDEFETVDFNGNVVTDAPKGRIDLIGITTREGAFDDQTWLPNNYNDPNIEVKEGTPRLAVVKGAGMLYSNSDTDYRVVIGGEKYHTIGSTTSNQNDYGRNFSDGSEVNDPQFGTVPLPDDIVNVCFHRSDINQDLIDWATKNRNADFFLPIAYVFVPDTYDAGEAVAADHLKDIRPFFRTAELTYSERQAIAASVSPSKDNPVITQSHLETRLAEDVNRDSGKEDLQGQVNTLLARIADLESRDQAAVVTTLVGKGEVKGLYTETNSTYLAAGFDYLVTVPFQIGLTSSDRATVQFNMVRVKDKASIGTNSGIMYNGASINGGGTNINKDDDCFGTAQFLVRDLSQAPGESGDQVECKVIMQLLGHRFPLGLAIDLLRGTGESGDQVECKVIMQLRDPDNNNEAYTQDIGAVIKIVSAARAMRCKAD